MKVGIYSCASVDLDPRVLEYQEKVFNKFGLEINQVIRDNFRHGHALDYILLNTNQDYYIIFDADCIPLDKSFYKSVCLQIEDKKTLVGAIGCANHIDPDSVYVHPCFMAFSKRLYLDLGCPSFNEWKHGDVGQLFSDSAEEAAFDIKYWYVTDPGDMKWDIGPIREQFGRGTVYEDLIYHQFEIRKGGVEQFINKCKEVINE